MRKFAATSALVIAAMGIAAGTVHADPAPAAQQGTPVSYYVNQEAGTLLLSAAGGGSLDINDGKLEIKAADGTVMGGVPLSAQIEDFAFPIAAEINGDVATLKPEIDVEHAVYQPIALPYQDQANWKSPYDREKDAFNRMKDTIGLAATASGLITTVLGGIVGCAIGSVAGAAITLPVALGGGSGPIVGCLLGAAAGASLIGIAGTILITVPVAIAAVIQYTMTNNEPFVAPAK
ncbi:hypothetical protein OHB26_10555 [Nocardia sp. NBC_01503]|uniref:hypothetical protein n=1 Tax=Nocardia sp. NBC_01503 TaxID=2975997 RepID=UPI002E7B57E2|nr:hypothetical protein [Nocardia sp. NBC_01503]WTL34590.1 hypothetical protein OHB26_10555 [Nocardia sp. NBC_01503]